MKKLLSLLLALALLAGFAGCAGPGETPATPAATQTAPALETTPEPTADPDAPRIFTDSSGRAVEVPANIATIAVTGPLAQIVVFALAPDLLAGIASEWDEAAALYLDAGYYELPVLGQLYGGKGELNLETLLASGAEVVIDVGEAKSTIVEDMDSLQAQTGIPFVHIDATVQTMGAAYAMLGELLNMREQAAALAEYCDAALAKAQAVAHGAEPVKLLYVTGAEGHNVIAKGSYHAGVIDMLSDNLAAVAEPSGKGTGNEVDMEQILAWNPEVVIFDPSSVYDTAGSDAAWQGLAAIQSGKYYEAPFGPYNWMGFPPSAQQYLGMLWMAKLLYPDAANYDLYEEAKQYFSLFYHCDLTRAQYDALVANSIGKAA
ncbi:MAG: Periplasmic binding protein [Firmicutes bacterium ADurb.Bin248]|nr:MAG: Periplasmic binding protein [Firmicutes bacterium ADurb.Bin248]HOG01079.1 ABC transporter substrate-binding protein [Clostridia bacterium]HPK14953.1 ABC transporter substrate-binding protein [Clostridia bacterium]